MLFSSLNNKDSFTRQIMVCPYSIQGHNIHTHGEFRCPKVVSNEKQWYDYINSIHVITFMHYHQNNIIFTSKQNQIIMYVLKPRLFCSAKLRRLKKPSNPSIYKPANSECVCVFVF